MTLSGLTYVVRHVDEYNRDSGVSHTLLRTSGGVIKMIAGALTMISPDNLAASLTGAFEIRPETVKRPEDLFVTEGDIAIAQQVWAEAEGK